METTSTIRAYFLFFGCIDVLMHYGAIREGHEAVWISLIGLTRGILYLCVGLALPAFLSRYVWLVNSLLVAGLCISFLNVFNRMLLDEARESPVGVVSRLITAVFLTMYVLNNVKRLAAVRPNETE
jgi:hypothetical protein